MTYSDLFVLIWLLSVVCLGSGIYRLSLSLLLVEEISASSEELQAKRMSEAFKTGMAAFEREREELLQILLKHPSSPYTCSPNSEFEMTCRTMLLRGKVGRRVQIWFFIPDGFVLTESDEKKVYRQPDDFAPPFIRTVRRDAEDLQRNLQNLTTVKLVAPSVAGKYNVLYEARVEGCVTPRGTLVVNVSDK
jgi:hypothetical protein